jgi:hypothetical protein
MSAPTLSITSAWKVPSAMRASACGATGQWLSPAILDLAPQPLRQGLGHADALAVAAQCVGVPVPRVGILWFRLGLGLGALGHLHEQVEAGLFLLLQVGGVDGGGLVGHGDAVTAGSQPFLGRLLEVAIVVMGPGLQHGGVLGQGLSVAGMQARPLLLEAGGGVVEFASVGEGGPFRHHCLRWGVCMGFRGAGRRWPVATGGCVAQVPGRA